jgi:excisionase family DNA binding protein
MLTVEQTGQRLGCRRTKVFALLREGAFPSVRIGRQRLVSATDVDEYLEHQLDPNRL